MRTFLCHPERSEGSMFSFAPKKSTDALLRSSLQHSRFRQHSNLNAFRWLLAPNPHKKCPAIFRRAWGHRCATFYFPEVVPDCKLAFFNSGFTGAIVQIG